MGISDDIQPKHRQPESENQDFNDVVELNNAKEDKEPVQKERSEAEESKLKNTFFAPSNTLKKVSSKRKIIALVLVIFVISMIALAAWQNLDLIKRRVFKISSSESKTTASTNEVNQISSKSATAQGSTEQPAASQTPVEQPAQTTPTATPPDKSSFTIRVSNGNGIVNSAQKVASSLKNAGFNVASVGNAGSFGYKTTIIYYQTDKEAEANLVKDALSQRSVSIQESTTLKTYAVLVIVGAK